MGLTFAGLNWPYPAHDLVERTRAEMESLDAQYAIRTKRGRPG